MNEEVVSQANDFNIRFIVCALFVGTWFSVREPLLGLPSGPTVLAEWLAFLSFALWIVWQPFRSPGNHLLLLFVPLASLTFLSASTWQRADLGQWSVYWRGFGPRVTLITLALTALTTLARVVLRVGLFSNVVDRLSPLKRIVTLFSATIALVWLLPSVLQPMDAWLNLGDGTRAVLDEIAGPLVGNIPGYNQAAGYSSLLGIPLLPLSLVNGRGQEKFILLVLWVNALIVAVPLLVALIVHKIDKRLPRIVALVLGFIAVTISGRPPGNEPTPFYWNSSLFRELSFLARGLFPLLVGYAVVSLLSRRVVLIRHLIFVASAAALATLNNPEFGIGSALAAFVVMAALIRNGSLRRPDVFASLSVFIALVGCTVLLGALAGGDWVGRRLGPFVTLLAGEGAALSSGSTRNAPAFGLVAVAYCVAMCCIATTLRILGRRTSCSDLAAPIAALYFGSWVVLSAPYTLNAGGAGAFGVQFLFIPLVIMSVALRQLVQLPKSEGTTEHLQVSPSRRTTLLQAVGITPVLFLASLILAAGLQAPNGIKEWHRIQTPINDRKWTDEWSPVRLDYIRTEDVIELADRVGGVAKVGWWMDHGNAIELLTGMRNVLGTDALEGAVRSQAIRELSCEPLTRSDLMFVITDAGALDTLNSCDGVEVVEATPPNEYGVVLVTLQR